MSQLKNAQPQSDTASMSPPAMSGPGYSVGRWIVSKFGIVLLVVLVFVLHVALRLDVTHGRQALTWPSYAHCYSTSLSLMLGRGYVRLPLAPDARSQPIKDFLDQKRDSLSAEEIAAYEESIAGQQSFDIGRYAYVDTARVFDMYLATAIWKLTGVSWNSLSNSYAVISALAGLAIFFCARQLTRNSLSGVFAAFLFALAPHEQMIRATRDINTIWFGAFAFAALFCLTNRYKGTWLNLASFFGLGLMAMLGYGWRPDNMIYVPFVLAAAAVLARVKGDSWRFISSGVACGLLAAGLVWQGVNSAYDLPKNSLGNRMHVAYFGEEIRCNLLGIENSLQVFRDDAKVASDAFVLHDAAANHAGIDSSNPGMVYCGENYGEACTTLYLQTLRHNLYHWTAGVPRILFYAAWGEGNFYVGIVQVSLLFAGACGLFLKGVDRLRLGIVCAFCVYYAAIWFGVTPEQRHWGPFLGPICIIASFAPIVLAAVVRAIVSWNWSRFYESLALRPAGITLASLAGLWMAACGVTYRISSGERAAYLAEIAQRAKSATSAASSISSPTRFTVSTVDEQQSHREGYLLTIETGKAPGELLCGHFRVTRQQLATMWAWPGSTGPQAVWDDIRNVIWWNAFSETRHRLRPNAKEHFFVTFGRSQYGGDNRRYTLDVELQGDARIVDAKRLDLANWSRMQVSTVISATDPELVSPRVGGTTTRTLLQFPTTPEVMALRGVPEKFIR